MSFFCGGFFQKCCLKSHFLLFCVKKQKTQLTLQKNRYFCEKCRLLGFRVVPVQREPIFALFLFRYFLFQVTGFLIYFLAGFLPHPLPPTKYFLWSLVASQPWWVAGWIISSHQSPATSHKGFNDQVIATKTVGGCWLV